MAPMNDTNQIRSGKKAAKSEDIFQAVCFSLDGIEYAIDVNHVMEIIGPAEIRVTPGFPPFIKGIIDYCQREVALMDLSIRLGLKTAGGKNNRIVVSEYNGKVIGLAVDAVTEVIRMETGRVTKSPGTMIPSDGDFLLAIYRDEDKQVPILDCARIFDF